MKLTLQEHESKLYDDFDRFTSELGESIHSYYWRYAKLINDINIIKMTMTKIQINTKFVIIFNLSGVDSERFKMKMLLAQAQESRVFLHEEQQDFLADRLEEMEDYCDDEATTSTNFMASLSPAGSINGDAVGPTYDSDILFELSNYDTYHVNEVLNSIVQETEYIEHIVSNDDSYDELTSDNTVISYADYMVTIENDDAQYVPPPEHDNAMMLFVIDQMKSQVEKRNAVNQEAKCVNESLSSDLQR
nr:hypothetical protein [Tanacetum cinerariifolium]